MILLALVATLLAGQGWVLGRAWLGASAPDPMVVVATLLALSWPRRRLLLAALMLGWVRALVLVEPAGGQVLCAWAALFLVASMRRGLRRSGRRGLLYGAVLLAGAWWCGALLVSWVAAVPVSGGRELFTGVLLMAPLSFLLTPSGRLVGAAR